jgi:predicted transcriptional regulator of viral defense system
VLAQQTKLEDFIAFLVRRRHLLSITLKSEQYGKEIARYCAGSPSPFALAASLRKNGYLSHGTAAYLHNLTATPPNQIYLNVEQTAKPRHETSLSQLGIDRAFAGKQRQSNLTFRNKDLMVTILAGKNTRQAGVEPATHLQAQRISTTNLERTLIDITVRPAYAGGIAQVLDSYRAARERASTQKLLSILDTLDYVYPYAQAIGFLMQRAGYREECLEQIRSRVTEFKFYLTHGLKDSNYDEAWRLFHPPGL